MDEEFVEPLEFDGEAVELDEQSIDPGEDGVAGLPVLADVHPIEPTPRGSLPAVQAAAAAATGFVAGAATLALVRRAASRRAARALVARGTRSNWPATDTRTFLVHVHVIGRSGD